jgi:hypothetical protein
MNSRPWVACLVLAGFGASHPQRGAPELAQACSPSWLPTFGELPGVEGLPGALAVFDDGGGAGPGLYVGGDLTRAGALSVGAIARWDGAWSNLGGGEPFVDIEDLLVFDDGSGSALYACGTSTSSVRLVARWDGASWTILGSGANGEVVTLSSFDDGGGPRLFAGGSFTSIGGTSASGIAKWDGASWLPLGSGLNGVANALVAHDDGSGPALFVGGEFTNAGGVSANHVAKWNGTSWSALGSGTGAWVDALHVFDDGSGGGPELYAGGTFTSAGGGTANRVARWDGASWSALGTGLSGGCTVFEVFDDGAGAALYAGGNFNVAGGVPTNGLARWNGTSWSTVPGMSAMAHIEAMAVFDDGSGTALYTGGYVFTALGAPYHIARWDGTSWDSLGEGLANAFEVTAPIRALGSFDDGSGAALFAGGAFAAPGVGGTRIARWDGASWSALGSGASNGTVLALATYDDGGGPALYVGGSFSQIGGVSANNVARWDGTSWSALGSGLDSTVNALCVFDDGGGAELVAGGVFSNAGGGAASRIARWNGASWAPVGGGLSGGSVLALIALEESGGPALFAGGSFTSAGGSPASRIARWDGAAWTSLASGASHEVQALAAFDDGAGDGTVLFAGGRFSSAGGVPANRIARWNGASWSALGSGLSDRVRALAVFDDASGAGRALYAGGDFTTAGAASAQRVARWNGATWSALGAGVNEDVYALAAFGNGAAPGNALFAGGAFTLAYDSLDTYLARWQGCPDTLPPEIVCPPGITAPEGLSGTPGRTVTFTVSATDDFDPAPTIVCVPPSGSFFPRGTTLVTCTATDAAGNSSSCAFEVVVKPKAARR